MAKFRLKPVVIDAVQLTAETFEQCCEFIGEDNLGDGTSQDEVCITISTIEGEMDAYGGDWIIRGIKGGFYSCKPDIFEATYEPVSPE